MSLGNAEPSENSVRCLVCNSSARVMLTEGELFRILAVAVVRNKSNGITGILLYNEGVFLQVLEGPLEAVQETFRRNCCDIRHYGVRILLDKIVPTRSFDSWKMGFPLRSPPLKALPEEFFDLNSFSPQNWTLHSVDPVVKALIVSFKSMFR